MKKLGLIIITIVMLLTIIPFSVQAQTPGVWDGFAANEFESGKGTKSSPYIIKTAGQLKLLAVKTNSGEVTSDQYYKLGADIKLNSFSNFLKWDTQIPGNAWEPIGNQTNKFVANFDGNGHRVQGMYINSNDDYQGLFGFSTGVIKNVKIEASYIKGGSYVGSVAGAGNVEKCTSYEREERYVVVVGKDYVGGIIGTGSADTCKNNASVTGVSYVGGVVGVGKAVNSTNTADVVGNENVGGITGVNNSDVTDCENSGKVNGTKLVGGISGWNRTNIINCKNSGAVNAINNVGGICGSGNAQKCNNVGSVTGTTLVGGITGIGNAINCTNSANVEAGENVGGIVGEGYGENCSNTGAVKGQTNVGGVVGYGNISICYNEGKVVGADNVGGVLGNNKQATAVVKGQNFGEVTGVTNVGGVVGYVKENVNAEHSSNSGKVTGTQYVGGIAGRVRNEQSKVLNCYNTGDVSAQTYVGGISGRANTEFCYNAGNISGEKFVGAIVGFGTTSSSYYLENTAYNSEKISQKAVGIDDKKSALEQEAEGAKALTKKEIIVKDSFAGFDFDSIVIWQIDEKTNGGMPYLHYHDFLQKSENIKYIKEAVACDAKPWYYYSCECGEKGTELFESAHVMGHTPTAGATVNDRQSCSACKITLETNLDYTNKFSDVKDTDWFKNAVDYNASKGYVLGVSNTEFGHAQSITRGMFVTILARIAGVDTTSNATSTSFADVAWGKYYTAAVKWASENGIVTGYTAQKFGPNDPITREQLCTIIIRFASYKNVILFENNEPLTFTDNDDISAYAKSAVDKCQRTGIISGYTETDGYSFKPQGNATRAEAAQILFGYNTQQVNRQRY